MSQPNLREIIRAEYKKCIEDPIYFMKKYVKIQHPVRGTVAFELYPFQENTLRDFVDNSLNIVLKSRQMGISTLTAAYSLWLMTFHSDKNILCISITQETAKEIVTKVRFANDNLPAWLKVPCVEDNRLSLRLKNGSQIKAVSSAGTAGRGWAAASPAACPAAPPCALRSTAGRARAAPRCRPPILLPRPGRFPRRQEHGTQHPPVEVGRHEIGQHRLARRLVEVGVKFVTVYFAQSIGGQ